MDMNFGWLWEIVRDREAWRAAIPGIAKSSTRLSDWTDLMQYCLQYRTLLLPPDTSTTERHFCFGPAASFFLEMLIIALHCSPVAFWTPSDLGGSSSSIYLFAFHTVHAVLEGWILKWVAISSSSGPRFVRNLHYILDGPAWHYSDLHWIMEAPLLGQGSDPCRGWSLYLLWNIRYTFSLSSLTKAFSW